MSNVTHLWDQMEEWTCCKRANSKANQSSKQLLVEDLIHEGQYTDTQQRAQTDYRNEEETQSPHWEQKIDHVLPPLLWVGKYQKSSYWYPLSSLPFPILNTHFSNKVYFMTYSSHFIWFPNSQYCIVLLYYWLLWW